MAQSNCTQGSSSNCIITLQTVSPVVDGCGDHATPGRFKFIFSSTSNTVTRSDFPVAGYFMRGGNEHRANSDFIDWEWRNKDQNNNRWNDPTANRISFAGGVFGENIIEVRPKAGAHIWSVERGREGNAGRSAAPGELVVQTFSLSSGSTTPYNTVGSAYFLFMGGKGCARVGPGGGLLGGNQ